MAPLAARVARARVVAAHRRIRVTAIEQALGTRYTVDTVTALARRLRHVRLVWIMGADNLVQLSAWHRWPALLAAVPVAIFDRPTYSRRALSSPAARRFARFRRSPRSAAGLSEAAPPAWVFVTGGLDLTSATRVREGGRWPARGEAEEPDISDASQSLQAETLRRIASGSLHEDKAEDVMVIDLAGKTTIADFMIIASGRSRRHVASIAEHLVVRLKRRGMGVIGIEGLAQADWVLIDAGDVIVHIFRPEVRSFYNLEKMWAVPLPEPAVQ
jgi:ribosome silencing factor RsfS/YbeB/iojap